ncbi:hypothetical protein Pla52n_00880 [Stieleria varia]|uniref:DUF4345 domain-containing protein n=1 Tax=Stieleria varia TaxID=2528005 RepID=A0A5C6B5E7_9BACT|nr:hypothetical protein Pla52n_00880 [Stieleria varia]
MDSNPYTSPTSSVDTRATTSPPSNTIAWLGRIASVALSVLGAMHLAVVLVAPRDSITLSGMLEITDSTTIVSFKLVYTGLLFLSVVSYARNYRTLAFVLSVSLASVTACAVLRSLVVDYRPSFYEWYAGETITVIASISLAIAAAWPRSPKIAA